MANQGFCNWLDLPRDVTMMILQKAGFFQILMNARLVCKYWHSITMEELSLCTRIDVTDLDLMAYYDGCKDWNKATKEMEATIRLAVDRSRDRLVDLNLDQFSNDEFIRFVTDRCTNIQRFRAVGILNDEKILWHSMPRLAMLKDLEMVYLYYYSPVTLETIGRSCPRLVSLKWNRCKSSAWSGPNNQDARAIASTMPQLRRLQLVGNRVTNKGVRAILDTCPDLEYLDLRGSYFVRLKTDIREKCASWIDKLVGPFDDSDEDFDIPHYNPNDDTWLKEELGDEVDQVDDDDSTIESYDSKFDGMQVGGHDSDSDSDIDSGNDNDLDYNVSD